MRTDKRTDRHDEANNRISQFCEHTKKYLNIMLLRRHEGCVSLQEASCLTIRRWIFAIFGVR